MKKVVEQLEFIQKTSGETCSYLHGKELNSAQTFCFGLLERLSHMCLTLKDLFLELTKDSRHNLGIGIIFRALLIDALIGMNLYRIVKDAQKAGSKAEEIEYKVDEFCNTILSDGIKNTLEYLEGLKNMGLISEEELAVSYNNTATQYRPFLNSHDGDGTKPLPKYGYYSPKKLFNQLASSDFVKLATIYDVYNYFSKYEHFGIMYFGLTREDPQKIISVYEYAIEFLIGNQAFIHYIITRYSNNDSFLDSQLKVANEYLAREVNG